MRLSEALALDALRDAEVVAGRRGLDNEVRWAHVVEIPDPLPWVREGQLLLTTGYAWPRANLAQHRLLRGLVERGLAGIGLAVPKYLERFPRAVVTEADRLGLPLMQIPWEVPFARITEEVNGAVIAEQYQVIEQGTAIHQSLTRAAQEAESLQDIADTLGELIGRAVTFEDTDGNVLGAWQPDDDLDPARRATLEQGRVPVEVEQHLSRLGYTQAIRDSAGPLRLPALPEIGLRGRIACPVRLKDELVGVVWIIEGEQQLNGLDLRAAEHASIVAALHVAYQGRLSAAEARLGASFLDTLLEGSFELTASNLERARLLGFSPEESYRAAVVVLDEPLPLGREAIQRRDRLADRLRWHLTSPGSMAVTSLQLRHVTFLLPASLEAARIWSQVKAPGLSMAVGRPHPGAEGVPRSYREAQKVAAHLAPGELRRYEELLIPRVLDGDREAQDDFLENLLGPLRRARGGEVLVDSVLCFARHGFRRNEAAAALHVHPNTLRYRLERAGDLAGLQLREPETRFRLQLAAQLLSLPDKKGQ
ncbi:MAG: PucR family transcriptional regulator [Candidatus Nephthysia bennettiae]|nr:MAG: PucR family transcriptional regulator [Candidatus Dormibacteraeota bacterium]